MFSVAIDGPAGAGKSTVAKTVAQRIGFIYVDTGAMYRAIALFFKRKDIPLTDIEEVKKGLNLISIKLEFIDMLQHIILNGEDVSQLIRTPEISMLASDVSAIKEVRAFLLNMQRDMAKQNNVIMDGRDIATVVLPNANVKIFLTATPEERAKRRYEELVQKGIKTDFQSILNDIQQRDYNDTNREIAPLKPAQDSIIVDTTDLSLEQAIEKVTDIIKERMS